MPIHDNARIAGLSCAVSSFYHTVDQRSHFPLRVYQAGCAA